MVQDIELKKLRKELAASRQKIKVARSKADIEIEKRRIKRELFLLRNPKKVIFAKDAGKALKRTGKIVGTAVLKQARLIKAQQERDARIAQAREQRFKPKKIKVRKSPRKTSQGFNLFDDLDF